MLWWWEHRPIKDTPHVFLCLADSDACREYYGQPFRYRLPPRPSSSDRVNRVKKVRGEQERKKPYREPSTPYSAMCVFVTF